MIEGVINTLNTDVKGVQLKNIKTYPEIRWTNHGPDTAVAAVSVPGENYTFCVMLNKATGLYDLFIYKHRIGWRNCYENFMTLEDCEKHIYTKVLIY